MSTERYAYNLDGDFEFGHETFESREAAVVAAREEVGEPLATVWTCRVEAIDIDAVCRSAVTDAAVGDLLDFVSEAACELVGEAGENWPTPASDTSALKAAISAALAKHLREVNPPTFYRAADVVEHEAEVPNA